MTKHAVMWAGSGSWEPSEPEPPRDPGPGRRERGDWGTPAPTGDEALVLGRFLPLHRGHQYLIDVARASSRAVTVAVVYRPGDEIPPDVRVAWLRDLYRHDVRVVSVGLPLAPEDPDLAKQLRKLVSTEAPKAKVLFGSELAYRAPATAAGLAFVPVDPSRLTVPISGTAIRASVMEHFGYIAPPARPWFVRRVAVVGAESTGKSTLCARLRAELEVPVAPEWTRVLVESGTHTMRSQDVQLIARTQIATEDALARQVRGTNGAVIAVDTDLRTVWLWATRLYADEPPAWIAEAIRQRPYDLYLLCRPDIPFVGSRERDDPAGRAAFHDRLERELAATNAAVVELAGSPDERFRTAADAIIGLYTPRTLLSARGAVMK